MKPVQKALAKLATPAKAKSSAWFFKTGAGEYAEGDQFIGVTVPKQRQVAKQFKDLDQKSLVKLLQSPIHEERLTALFIMVIQFKHGDTQHKKWLHQTYLANTKFVNNWDLVDSSAEVLVGQYLADKDRSLLIKLAKSQSLWEKRIAMIATYHYIKAGDATWGLKVAEVLINDSQDLIQKAVGWMLREIGKRCSREVEEEFLVKHYKTMPRTALRYAIEHFEPPRRRAYLKGNA